MREPRIETFPGSQVFVPYSVAPLDALFDIINDKVNDIPDEMGAMVEDTDFHRRYAAILLRERGL